MANGLPRESGAQHPVLAERFECEAHGVVTIDLDIWMIDSTAVRATRASSGVGKKVGLKNR
jgi:hypothetical protein